MQEINNAYEFLYKFNNYVNNRDDEADEIFNNSSIAKTFATREIFESKIHDPKLRKIFLRP